MILLRPKGQMSESMAMAVLLTLAGGFQDAYSYNCRGGVFVNAQTGNIVLLGQNLAQGNFKDALHYVMPLAGGLTCATTMCIGNMRSGAELISKYHLTKEKALKKKGILYFGVIMIFAAGAALGAVMSMHIGLTAIWAAALLLLLGFLLMFIKEGGSVHPL